jgi:hypothetical protein
MSETDVQPQPACDHKEFQGYIRVARLEDTTPMSFYADVKISCKGCGMPYHFRGVTEYGLSPYQPCLNPDATELRCPISPGPAEFVPTRLSFKVM